MGDVAVNLNDLYESAFELDNEECLETFLNGLEMAREMGDTSNESRFGAWVAFTYMNMGLIDEALALADKAVVLDRENNNLTNLPQSLVVLGGVHLVLGDWSHCKSYLDEASRISQGQEDFEQVSNIHWSLGWLYFEKEDYIRARKHQAIVYEASVKEGDPDGQFDQWYIWTHIKLGELDTACRLIARLHEFAAETNDGEHLANAYTLGGILACSRGNWTKAIEQFERALKQHEAIDSRRWNAYWFAKMLLCEFAQVYLERNRQGDRAAALNLLDQALMIFQRMDAVKDIDRVLAKKKRLKTQ